MIFSKQRKGRKLNKEWADKVRINLDKSRGRKSKLESIEKRKQTMIKNNSFKHSPETIEKIRLGNIGKKRTEEQRKKYSISNKNRPPFSEEHKMNIGIKSKGRIFSDESKIKISKNSAKAASKIVLHLQTGVYFDSAKEASLCFNFKHSTFKSMLNGNIKINRTNCIYA